MNIYFTELKYLLLYIAVVFLTLASFYSVFVSLDADTILFLTEEDGVYEWLTVLFFLGASFLSLRLYLKTRNIWFILFCAAFIFAAGEEISWGQRIFGFVTPEGLREKNIQDEFTIHNLYIFSRVDAERNLKTGILRMLEFNFLFKVGTVFYGMVLPFMVFHFTFFRKLTQKIKFPVPPITIGTFFLINWMVYRFINVTLPMLAIRSGEIFEAQAAFIILVIFLFYFWERKNVDFIGSDIKHTLQLNEKKRLVPVFNRKLIRWYF